VAVAAEEDEVEEEDEEEEGADSSRSMSASGSVSCGMAARRVMEQRRACAYCRYGPVSPSKEVMRSMENS
jgi:hypothetical protein